SKRSWSGSGWRTSSWSARNWTPPARPRTRPSRACKPWGNRCSTNASSCGKRRAITNSWSATFGTWKRIANRRQSPERERGVRTTLPNGRGSDRRGDATMTKFGKALVLFNLVFSLLMAVWAIGVFTNRVDFSNTKKPDQVMGLLAQREGRVNEVKDAFRPADAGWTHARAAVYFQESLRPKLTAWYAEQLQNARDGNKEIGEVDMTKELARQRDPASFSPVVTNPQGVAFNPRFF